MGFLPPRHPASCMCETCVAKWLDLANAFDEAGIQYLHTKEIANG